LAYEGAKALLVDAETMITQGLECDSTNESLLRLRTRANDLRQTVMKHG
jgi:hypothetical protein